MLFDATQHRVLVSHDRRNLRCRFDHECWRIAPLPRDPRKVRLGGILGGTTAGGDGSPGVLSLAVAGHPFARRLVCAACGRTGRTLHLSRRLSPAQLTCTRCGKAGMVFGSLDLLDRIRAADLSVRELRHSLQAVGFQAGDVVTVQNDDGQATHFELGSGNA